MQRKVLKGLTARDYVHPQEEKFRNGSDSGIVARALDLVSDLNAAVMRRITLGKYVEVNALTAPRLSRILEEVCQTLDFPELPRLYVCHQAAQNAFCLGVEHKIICISDYMIHRFDDEMVRFMLGNLVGMFKGGHMQLANVCSLMLGGPEMLAFRLPLLACLRAADLSSDRAGLLACQSFSGAARMILWEAGYPLEETLSLDEEELMAMCRAMVEETELISPSWMNLAAAGATKLTMEHMPPAFRLRELLEWYAGQYPVLMRRWK